MDPEPIPTEPTTDPEPPDATSVATGPSLASESPAAGRGRGTKVRRAAIGLALVLTFSVGIGVGGLVLPALGGAGAMTPAPASGNADFGLIKEAWDTLHTKYVGASKLNDRDLIYGAINGMTEAVGDTGHTSFMTPEERAARSSGLSGKYVGIGVRIDIAKDGLPLVVGVFKDSPADKAGLTAGDEIVAVDGKTTTGHQLDEIVGWVRGEAGSTVAVTVRPGATGTERTGHDGAGRRRGRSGLVDAGPRLEDRADPPRAVLVGRRGQPQARPRRGPDRRRGPDHPRPARQPGWLRQRGRRGRQPVPQERDGLHRARGRRPHHVPPVAEGGLATDLPLVVLVDAGTASSSEIVSGALQDAGRAEIVGIKTYGTGTVLGEFVLSDGSALRVGTVEWLTPKGNQIWHKGITPDVVVERASDVARACRRTSPS